MKRLTWEGVREYWVSHASRVGKVDYDRDPDGLGNVCLAGAPLWLNRYYARFQRRVFDYLLGLLPPAQPGAWALDVGCGAGRWSRRLASHGYRTVGIDVQEDLIRDDSKRYPRITFVCTSIQDYVPSQTFHLICSVTVIQHVPFEEQKVVLRRLRGLAVSGGHLIALENVRDQKADVFANSEAEWQEKFREAGFVAIAARHYDYSPFLRAKAWLGKRLRKDSELSMVEIKRRSRAGPGPRWGQRFISGGKTAATGVCVALDSLIEPVCLALTPSFSGRHCGFLLKAV